MLQRALAQVAGSLTARHDSSPCADRGANVVCLPINTQIAMRHEALGESTGFGIGEDGDPGFTLQAGHSHAVAIRTAQTSANGHGVSEDVSHTLDGAQGQAVMALAIRGRGESRDLESREDGTSNAILTPNGGRDGMGVGAVLSSMAVRRLLPEECEALQGFPRGYTKISDKTADGPRYKALGNSMAVPCMRWIGECIQKVEDSL